jgi:hypothetical protein
MLIRCFFALFTLTIRFLNAAKAFKSNCRQSQLLDDHSEQHGVADAQVRDANLALRAGLSSSKRPIMLDELVPSSLLPASGDIVQSTASSLAVTLAARHHTLAARETVGDSCTLCMKRNCIDAISLRFVQSKDISATAGKGWFDMPKPVMTKELAVDLKILQAPPSRLSAECRIASLTRATESRRIKPRCILQKISSKAS